ncbi:erythromycin esterase family protein [Acetanaerobacterium elongatum]|uniref:Erythromycin esterase n=1 Tax=Acetanaerobacterium elongatum TaxID=258515 RepID=A0A1H0E335_9FIRM|nr:erythromycin esterase family protein [Acetanaerobacterium elongatum]SDN76681.1 erythromycin esterase [Acetanaerobacterium elongatum]
MKKFGFLFVLITLSLALLLASCAKTVKVANISEYLTNISDLNADDSVRIVGLGEATHGNVEFQTLKKEVFQALVQNNHCRVFALEGDFGGCQRVNEFVQTGEGTAEEAAAQIGFGIYRTKEMADLIRWIRDFNAGAQEGDKIRFYGFDMQRFDNNKAGLFNYLEKVDAKTCAEYKTFFADLNDETVYDQDKEKVKAGKESAQKLITLMTANQAQYVSLSSEKEFVLALQYAQCIGENATLQTSSASYAQLRDQYMAQKVKWILDYEQAGMIFIAGHNGHIDKSSAAYGYTSMGKYLSDEFGSGYFAIGTDFYNTTFRAVTSGGEVKNFTLKNSNVLTEQFINLDGNVFYLSFKDAEKNDTLNGILNQRLTMGSVGSEFNDWQKINGSFYTLQMIPRKSYDGIIIVKDATPTVVAPLN